MVCGPTVCPHNTYKDDTNTDSCTACPAESSSNAGAQARDQCLCNAGWTGDLGGIGQCSECAEGTYKASEGTAACTSCSVNNVSPLGSVSSTACVCDIGHEPVVVADRDVGMTDVACGGESTG